jgi:hypothetical protein
MIAIMNVNRESLNKKFDFLCELVLFFMLILGSDSL